MGQPESERHEGSDENTLNLDDINLRGMLTQNGLTITFGDYPTHKFSAVEEGGSTGFVWIRDETQCVGIVNIQTDLQAPTECCGFPGLKTWTLRPERVGRCIFRMVNE